MQSDPDHGFSPHSSQGRSEFTIPDHIPLFPLPNLVFFPKTYLPLHIFEPRYQDMVSDAASRGQCIGMALLKEGWEDNYYGNPPLYPLGCVGRIVSIQEFPDGRSNILLQGLSRYVIEEEMSGKQYRRARISLKPQSLQPGLSPELQECLAQALFELLEQHEEEESVLQGFSPPDGNDEVLVNTLSSHLDFTPLEKQFLLEAESLNQQARRLSDLLQFKRHERDGVRGWG